MSSSCGEEQQIFWPEKWFLSLIKLTAVTLRTRPNFFLCLIKKFSSVLAVAFGLRQWCHRHTDILRTRLIMKLNNSHFVSTYGSLSELFAPPRVPTSPPQVISSHHHLLLLISVTIPAPAPFLSSLPSYCSILSPLVSHICSIKEIKKQKRLVIKNWLLTSSCIIAAMLPSELVKRRSALTKAACVSGWCKCWTDSVLWHWHLCLWVRHDWDRQAPLQ